MTVICSRHPAAASHSGHCTACLIEEALAGREEPSPEIAECTVTVPLGSTPHASVFVVQSPVTLRRLKTWKLPAPPHFVEQFDDLRRRLHDWSPAAIALPLETALDEAGHPSVLSEFRQGMPLLEAVSAKWITGAKAAGLLRQLGDVITAAHARGLAHGSLVPGNIIVSRDGDAFLTDFGMAPLLAPPGLSKDWIEGDLQDYASRAAELDGTSRL